MTLPPLPNVLTCFWPNSECALTLPLALYPQTAVWGAPPPRRPRFQSGRVVIFTVIPAPPTIIPTPPTVIPAQAGIYALRSHSPSFRLLQPSFRRKPESTPCGHTHRHSDPQPSFRRKPESMPCGHIHRHSGSPIRHSGSPTVIPAQAGIYALRSHSPSSRLPQPSFRLAPESMLAGSITIVGDHDAGFRLSPERRLQGHRNAENVRRTMVNRNMTTPPGRFSLSAFRRPPQSGPAFRPYFSLRRRYVSPFQPNPKIAPRK